MSTGDVAIIVGGGLVGAALACAWPCSTAALRPGGDTLVCRCEEVSAAALERVIELGCSGPDRARAFTRCGMGPCQGRWCAASVTQMFAERRGQPPQDERRGQPPQDADTFRARPPLQPITLGQLARANQDLTETRDD